MEVKVKGMMCGHCEMHVVKAVSAIAGVTEVTASHETGIVSIKSEKDIDLALVKAAVEEAGYEYIG